MPKGFFSASTLLSVKAPPSLLPQCGACKLFKRCNSPKMPPKGKGKESVLFIAEAPSDSDDRRGKALVGPDGRLLRDMLRKMGFDLDADCWVTYALICRSGKAPDDKQIKYCQPNLIKHIKELNPTVIIPMGFAAVKSLISSIWKDDVGPVTRWVGWQIPYQKWNAWICPTFDPAYVLKEIEGRKKNPIPDLMFKRHIESAIGLCTARPWKQVPDHESKVDVIVDPSEAASVLNTMTRKGGLIAFDYETTTLKPDHQNSRIVCCGVSWRGKKTIAYPWHGEAIEATRKLLRSGHPMIASNLKFEQRWTKKHLKTRVRNWAWDTMIAAHVINNQPKQTSVKFQSFVLLGSSSYNDHIEPLLKGGPSSYDVNRVTEIELNQLLLYCGLDALLEYKVAVRQMEFFKELPESW